jgi:hypothetical protein
MPTDQTPKPAQAGSPGRDDRPVLPVRSEDDSDTGWGEAPEPDDAERWQRDRPPHWDSP